MLSNAKARTFSAGLILLSGLVSCSPDKDAGPEIVSDSWPRPKVVIAKDNSAETRVLKNLDQELESSDSIALIFDDDRFASSIRRLSVRSACQALRDERKKEPEDIIKNEYKLENLSKFRLLDALPDPLLLREDARVQCHLIIRIVNGIGSTKTIEFPRLLIYRKSEVPLGLAIGTSQPSFDEPIPAPIFEQISFVAPTNRGSFKLSCRHMQAELRDVQLSTARLSHLALQPKKLGSEVKPDLRELHPVQPCRIVFRGPAPLHTAAVSSPFVLNFGAPQVEVDSQWIHQRIVRENDRQPVIMKLSLRNPNAFPVSLRLPKDLGSGTATLLYVLRTDSKFGIQTGPHATHLSLSPGRDSPEPVVTTLVPKETRIFPVYATFGSPICQTLTGTQKMILNDNFATSAKLAGALHTISNPERFTFDVAAEAVSTEKKFLVLDQIQVPLDRRPRYQIMNDGGPADGRFTKGFTKLDRLQCLN